MGSGPSIGEGVSGAGTTVDTGDRKAPRRVPPFAPTVRRRGRAVV